MIPTIDPYVVFIFSTSNIHETYFLKKTTFFEMKNSFFETNKHGFQENKHYFFFKKKNKFSLYFLFTALKVC